VDVDRVHGRGPKSAAVLGEAGRKGDLSRFVEEAVKSRLLELSMKSVPTHSRPSANEPVVEYVIEDIEERNFGG
jgi:hypothetical protein